MLKFLVSKLARQLAVLYLVAVISLLGGYLMGRPGLFYAPGLEKHFDKITAFLQTRGWKYPPEESRNIFGYSGFIQRDPGFIDSGYLLLSRFSKVHGQDIVELVRLKDFKTIHSWFLPIRDALKLCGLKSDRLYAQHPLLLKNGELVFIASTGMLVKIDRDSRIIWAQKGSFHHSIELASDGHMIICMSNDPSSLHFPFHVTDDGYAVVTQEGRIISRFSAAKILMDNGYAGLFLGTGNVASDRLHMNSAHPINRDTEEARTGDIAISLRDLSTVMLFRPATGKIVWLKTGPWIHQHDIDSLSGGGYSIFGNDGFSYGPAKMVWTSLTGSSNIYLYDPQTGGVKAPFTSILEKIKMYSPTEGVSRVLPNGDVFIEETCSSRVLRVSTDHVRWEYVNGATKTSVGMLQWSRYLTDDEFKDMGGDKWE